MRRSSAFEYVVLGALIIALVMVSSIVVSRVVSGSIEHSATLFEPKQ